MQVYNALELKSGKKVEHNRMGTLQQPIQFLPEKEKDDEWVAWNIDWIEWQGLKQLRRNAKPLLKNFHLSKGEIDRSDYIVEDGNEYSEMIDILTKEGTTALELKFFPIIPIVVDVLANEFTKRISKVTFRATDDLSYNEKLEDKRQMIEDALLEEAKQKQIQKIISMGLSPQSDDAQKMLSPDALKSLPEIEQFFRKDYKSIYEDWATHQMSADIDKFSMQELEQRAFRDMLITDREFWHFRMGEDDYEVELWNPIQTFYHKSPSARYISQCNWVGMTDVMTLADVVDKYGWMMTADQLRVMETIYPAKAAGYLVPGLQNDGSYYDATRSHDWNVKSPSLGYRQFMSMYTNTKNNGDIINWILGESEDLQDWDTAFLLRVSTIYWKTQRKIFHLTRITDTGETIQDIVGEDYRVTDKPLYNTTIYKTKTKDNLIFGEHLDPLWVNEVWGGIKIGPNRPSFWGMNAPGGINPLYIGMNGGKPGKIPFQFKGDATLYGCKPPVEGCVFNDRNTRSISCVDKLKPFQIGFNLVNNQIADILVDELGTVIVIDQNTLPRHSLGEDWGKNNYEKAFVAMKNFQILPLDTTISNTENAINFQHYQVANLEQTQRLMTRVQLANYYETQAYKTLGLNPTRLGQPLSQQQTAKGVEEALNSSYAQTEHYFTQHSDYLMPRVHQMRTELAQYYNSTKPSVRLQYLTSKDETMDFQINGTELLGRDFNVYCTTKVSSRDILEKFKQLVVANNTMGATIFDLGNVMKAESLSEMDLVLKGIEAKSQAQKSQEMQMEQQQHEQELANQEKLMQMKFDHETLEKEKDRQKDILVAEIRSASTGGGQDVNQNQQSDYLDALDRVQKERQYQDTMNIKRVDQDNKMKIHEDNQKLAKGKIAAERDRAAKDLQIARENKTDKELSNRRNKK